ncbi:META domain-containing protein [Parasphingopyxis sp.]|uniref:META domain-containing protein n=1 Tax=Parasphingopyxis sp. TaxID=1920299 RepID=UPI00262295C2|nr:META domain-containing protein [Parasphingopyxis sp.]
MPQLFQALTFLLMMAVVTPAGAQGPAFHSEEVNESWTGYTASGTEPFWQLIIDDEVISFENFEIFWTLAPRTPAYDLIGATAFQTRIEMVSGDDAPENLDGRDMVVIIRPDVCTDGMSDHAYPQTVNIFMGDEYYGGCGGDPATILHGDWQVIQLGSETMPQDGARITISFGTDGSVSGSGGCNRYGASYEIHGNLTIDAVRSTRRACPEPIGGNESRFFALLGEVVGYGVPDSGGLSLYTVDRTDIVLLPAED